MAKYSPGKAKMAQSRAKTYPDARDAMLAERCGCSASKPPSQEVRDAAAEKEIDGGYRIARTVLEDGTRVIDQDQVCNEHFVVRNSSGVCPLCAIERK